ncbi:MAG: hypothetical protein WHV66_00075 [Anaerolineales bacterium]
MKATLYVLLDVLDAVVNGNGVRIPQPADDDCAVRELDSFGDPLGRQ